MLIIAVVSLLLYVGLVFYIGWSGWQWMNPRSGARKAVKYGYIAVVAVAASSFMLGQFTGNLLLDVIGAYWMAVFYLAVLLVPLARITGRLLRLTRLSRHHTEKAVGAATLIMIVALLAFGSFNAYSPVVRSYDIRIAKPAPGVETLNIVMAADMHFGLLSGRRHAERLVREINALRPDLVLFPGDLLDDGIEQFQSRKIGTVLSGIDARYGVYASLGNHDRHHGPAQELLEALEQGGMRVLYDEAVVIDDAFTLVGRRDRSDRGRAPLAALMANVDTGKPVILLDHQPFGLEEARQLGVDLMVSGHTHRGQVFPGNWITERLYENDWGHLQRDGFHSIVTSGYGFWGPPIRIGSRSEIVQITVTFSS